MTRLDDFWPHPVVVAGDTLYVTGGGGGLYILRWLVDTGAVRSKSVYLPIALAPRNSP